MNKIEMVEEYAPRQKFLDMGEFSVPDFAAFIKKHNIVGIQKGTYTFYPIFEMIKALNRSRKTRGKNADSYGGEGSDLDQAKKYEEVIKLRIVNQERMGELIPRERARIRVLTLLNAFSMKLRYSIKNTAAQIAGMIDARAIENIMTQNYNDVIDMLEREAKLLTWREDGVSDQLGRTELSKDTGENISDGSSEEDSPSSEE